MARIPLTGGAYTARSVIASAQRQVNLYSEPMPAGQGEPSSAALYPMPGTRTLVTMEQGPIRGGHLATNGAVYVCAGDGIYALDANWSATPLGSITPGVKTPVSMRDNGQTLVIVDGSANGWTVDLATNTFAQIADPGGLFVGADRVDYLDTFLLFNQPGTPRFYWSLSGNPVTFDPLALDFALKSSAPDLLITLVVAKRQIWLLGRDTGEVFYDIGAPGGASDSQFAAVPGVMIDYGCAAKYSAAEINNSVYWLARDRRGQGLVIEGSGLQTKRVSTYAIEAELATYARLDDAIGFSFQIGGHLFYCLAFPHADKCWAYDVSASAAANEPRWHEWVWLDTNGTEHRHRANCAWFARGLVVVGDWETGKIYALDPAVFTDDGQPIKRQRDFPHLVADGKRIIHRQLIVDIETGTGGNQLPIPPRLSLAWSNDRGHSWGSPISQSIGASGEYLASMQFQRLGLARDRVYSVRWSSPYKTALQGIWLDAKPAQS